MYKTIHEPNSLHLFGTCYLYAHIIYLCVMNKPDKQRVFSISNEQEFTDTALTIFRFQAENCKVYREFISNLGTDAASVSDINGVPFLPISFFKSHNVISDQREPEAIF